MLFNKSCSCGEKPVHEEIIPTMAGDVKLRYCQECWDKKHEHKRLQQEEWNKLEKERQIEINKQKRYEYLKREIEIVELEKKAKELGIII